MCSVGYHNFQFKPIMKRAYHLYACDRCENSTDEAHCYCFPLNVHNNSVFFFFCANANCPHNEQQHSCVCTEPQWYVFISYEMCTIIELQAEKYRNWTSTIIYIITFLNGIMYERQIYSHATNESTLMTNSIYVYSERGYLSLI